MHAETLSAARTAGCPWTTRTLTLLLAALVVLASRAAFAQTTFTVGTNLVDISKAKGNETDPCIAINPLNPSNMVVVAATDQTNGGLFFAFTANMGGTWKTNFIATNGNTNGLIPTGGANAQPSVAFDAYSNLYLAYLPGSFEGIAVAVSTNGGSNFVTLTNLVPFDVTDQPRITAPAAGAAAGSVWVVYQDYTTPNTPLQVQGLLSTGPGVIGTFGPAQIVPGSTNGGFADIAVGPLGQVMVAFQDNLNGLPNPFAYPKANIWVSVQTNSVVGGMLTNRGFRTPAKVASDAIGGVTYLAAAPTGIGVNASPGLAWNYDNNNTNYGSAYLVYTAVGPNGNAVISFLSSTNAGTNASNVGTNWNGKTYVDDDAITGFGGMFNDHFLPRVAVDPLTGILACSWYDCRNDLGANSQTITNVSSTSIIFTGLTMVTNISFIPDVPFISESTNISVALGQTNITVIIDADNVFGTTMTSGTSNITIGGLTNTNFVLDFAGNDTNGGLTEVTVILTNVITLVYTSGNGANQEAVAFTTLSFDDGRSFLANQQLTPPQQTISQPARGIASDAVGSDSLTGWGHYTGLAAYGANFFPVWADNSDSTTNNPDGANTNFDIYMLGSGPGHTSVSVPVANLSIWVTNSPNPVLSDGVILYSVIVSNGGPMTAKPLAITNILSPDVTLVPNSVTPALGGTYFIGQTTNNLVEIVFDISSIKANVVLTNTFRVTASTSSIATNFVTVYSPFINLFPTNTSNQLVLVIEGQDLAMGLTAPQTNVLIGDTVVSTVTVTNLGPASNGAVFITNSFSTNWTNVTIQAPGTNFVTNTPTGPVAIVNLGLVPVGSNATATFFAVALSDGTAASESAKVASQDVDTNLANNSASLSYFVNGENLTFGMTSSSAVVGLITYTIYVTNLGLSDSGLVTVSNTFSTNLGQFSVTQSQGTNAVTGSKVVLSLGLLGAGQIASMTITAVVVSGPASASDIVSVSSTDFHTNLASYVITNQATVTPAPPPLGNLSVTALGSTAFISFSTGSPANVRVLYGPTTNYGSTSSLSAPASTNHVVLLTGLTGGTNYDFEVLVFEGSTLLTTNGSFSLTNTIILATPDAVYAGLWNQGTGIPGIYGNTYQYTTTTNFFPTAWATYDPSIPYSALYNLFIWYPTNATFTTNAQVYVYGGTNDFIVSVNQTTNGGAWYPLASNTYFASGTNGSVILYNDTGETNKYLVANALMWAYDAAQDSPTNGSVPPWWANFFYGTNNVNGSALAGNGYSIYDNYVLGANPTDPASGVSFIVAPASGNEVSVTFSPYQVGRLYQLQTATSLVSPLWITLTNGFTLTTNGTGMFTVAQTNASSAFYRLSAQISP
jgi:uncharacterized repeat protein (TIGR01451 family)